VRATWALPAIAAISGAIAWIAPFDLAFTAAAGNSPLRRLVLIVALALVGGIAARLAGLKLEGHGTRSPVLLGLAWAALAAAWVVVLDCYLFRGSLAPGYAGFLHTPLHVRLFYFMLRAFNENVLYRLFAFGSLALALQRIFRGRRPPGWVLFAAMVAVQVVNIGMNVVWHAPEPITLARLGYDAMRYILPGVIWAWLFVRNGFATAEVASVGCHLFLQPAFSVLLDR